MAQDRTTLRTKAAIERRPPAATQRSAVAATPSPASVLQQRLGNQGTQAFIATMSPAVHATTGTAPPKSSVVAQSLSPLIPPQAPTSGVIPIPGKDAVAPTPAKVSAPGSKAPAEGASSATASAPPTSKPADKRPAIEAPKATAAPGAAKAPAGGPGGKAGKAAAPNARKAIGPAIAAVQRRATATRKHSPPGVSVASAQAAAISPGTEQKRAAATQTVANLDAAKAEEVKRNEFKTKLKQAIEAATPKPTSESQANKVMKEGAAQASGTLRGQLATERDAATGPIRSAGTEVPASSQPAPPVTALQSETIGPPPAPVSAAPVVPESLPAERLDYSADRAPADQVMAENEVTTEQLQEGKDPAFGPTITARSSAEKHEATAEAKYRQGEDKVQDQAQNQAAQALAKDLAGMHGARVQQLGKVDTKKSGTKDKNAQERQRVTDTIDGIKNKTRADVEVILASMETEAGNIFEAGLQRAEKAYEDTFEEAKGGVGTWLTTWGSDWDKLIEKSLGKARTEYLNQVDVAIDEVANCIAAKLKAAKDRVAAGRKEVEDFVKGLDASVKQFGEDALQTVSEEFDTMGSDIDQRRDGLISKLTEQYKASYDRMSAMENKLREANKSLWQRVYDATVGLIKKIIEFKNMLLSTLAKAAAVIGDIIAHPIRFLGNLVSAVMQGVKNFRANIGTHLLKGLMDWIFGALSGAGLVLPDKFDLQGIISIVLQILGLTKENIRARAVAIVGEPVVAAIEKTAEVFIVIAKEGVPGIWRLIQGQLANLKSMVLDAIFAYIKEKVIVAGITWIIGLLNPASAFFKACKAIYDIIMFFVTRGKQIMALVNAVIDSISAIAKGAIGAAAGLVENALAKAIPVAIGFLASLLGIGDPSKPVKEFIEKARAPVNKAIDWVINLAVKGVKAVGKFVGGLVGGKKDDKDKKDDPEKEKKVEAGLAALEKEENALEKDGEIEKADAEKVAAKVKTAHPVFKSLTVVDGGTTWDYDYVASPGKKRKGAKKLSGGKMSAEKRKEALEKLKAITAENQVSPALVHMAKLEPGILGRYKGTADGYEKYLGGIKNGQQFDWPLEYLKRRASFKKGKAIEAEWIKKAVGASKNSDTIEVKHGRTWVGVIPDFLTATMVGDCKDWATLTWRPQLRDFYTIAKASDNPGKVRKPGGAEISWSKSFVLIVRHESHSEGGTKVSPDLEANARVIRIITDKDVIT